MTVTLADAVRLPRVAVTVALGTAVAVNVVEAPELGATVPPPLADQPVADTLAALPYWSLADAVNTCVPPTFTVGELGETFRGATAGPADTVHENEALRAGVVIKNRERGAIIFGTRELKAQRAVEFSEHRA